MHEHTACAVQFGVKDAFNFRSSVRRPGSTGIARDPHIAWGFYINDSLRSLITTGQGQPNQSEEENREKASL